jgi:histidyl-tRNA synthetase
VGFGFGDVVISLMLEERGLFPSHDNEVAALVAAFSAEESSAATLAARALREAGVRTELDVSFQKLKKVFARASRQGFSHVVIAGPEEVREGMLAVKDLRAGVEEKVPAGELVRVVISGRG